MYKSKKGIMWLAVGVIICLGILATYFLVVQPELQGMTRSAESRAQATDSQIVHITNFHNAHLDDEKKYEQELTQRQERADRALPDDIEQGRFVSYLEHQALGSHLELREVTPGDISAQDGIRTLPVRVKLRGDYFGLIDFFEAMEAGERYTIIKNLLIKSAEGHLDCEIEIDAYAMDKNNEKK